MHRADDENYSRGYQWWLMTEAKKVRGCDAEQRCDAERGVIFGCVLRINVVCSPTQINVSCTSPTL